MEVVSCGEDGSVMVWSGAELVQSLPHPCCVWAVKSIPNTGKVSASYIICVFTRMEPLS